MNYFVNTDDPGLRAQYGDPEFQVVAGPDGQPTQLAQIGDHSLGQTAVYLAIWGAAVSASVYHGYKRYGTSGGAVGYGVSAFLFPLPTLVFALFQGFAKPR